MDSGPGEFAPGVGDPVGFDREATRYLIGVCHPVIEPVIARLRRERFAFASMRAAHADALDVEVLYRQCIPAACLGLAAGVPERDLIDHLEAYALCQTLILNHVDRHLDLSTSPTAGHSPLLLSDVRVTGCYALAALYEGISVLPPSAAGAAALAAMARVSVLIVQSMYENYTTRFDHTLLREPERVLADYRDPLRTRHLGSGFYSSSVLGLYAYAGVAVPDDLPGILEDLRRVRQRVDELADLHEDTVTGMVTYPVALLLAGPRGGEAREVIGASWARCRALTETSRDDALRGTRLVREDPALRAASARLVELGWRAGALETCRREADELCLELAQRIGKCLDPPAARLLRVVLDLKRALLQRLAQAGWDNVPLAHSLEQMRLDVLTGSRRI